MVSAEAWWAMVMTRTPVVSRALWAHGNFCLPAHLPRESKGDNTREAAAPIPSLSCTTSHDGGITYL